MYIATVRVKFTGNGPFGVQKKIEEALKSLEGFDSIESITTSHMPKEILDKMDELELSDNQRKFIEDAVAAGLEIRWHYSGRGMYGKSCPAVLVDDFDFKTTAGYSTDNLGRGTIYYARS